ncbi:MAG: helix-turn-helix transcriptional regulator [Bacillota bacterium]
MKEAAGKKFEWRPGAFVLEAERGKQIYIPVKLSRNGKPLGTLMMPADETKGQPEQEIITATLQAREELLAAADAVKEDGLPELARQLRETGAYQGLLGAYMLDLLGQLYRWRLESLPKPDKLLKDRPWLTIERERQSETAKVALDYDRREVEDLEEIITRVTSALVEDDEFWLKLARRTWAHVTAWLLLDVKREVGSGAFRAMPKGELNRLFWERLKSDGFTYYTYYLSLDAQDLVREISPKLIPELERAPLESLEWLLGLRKERPAKGENKPLEKPLRAAVRNGLLATPSNRLYHELRRALALKGFREDVDGWPSQPVTGEGYSALMQLRPSPREAIPDDALEAWRQRMWALREGLSDVEADVLDGVTAIWLENARHKDDMVVVTADRLLRMRGLKPRPGGRGRGGYSDRQRQKIADAVERLDAVWLNVAEAPIVHEETDRRGRTRKVKGSWAIQSRALVVSSRVVQRSFWGPEKIHAWRVRPGDFFTPYLLGPGRQTALLSQKALSFDPHRQTWEKRLTRYFAYQWRVRARGGKYEQPFRVATLLEECDPEYAAKRIRWLKERLEKALNTLKEHGVIARWRYEYAEGSGMYRDPATGEELPNYEAPNARDWLNWTVLVEPPPEIVQHYQELRPGKERVLPAGGTPAGLSEEIRAWRRREGLSLREAARLLGVGYGYLSEIERGVKQPTPDLAARLKATISGQVSE